MKKPVYILGINGSHISSAALLRDGKIIACAQEERFRRIKGIECYPELSIDYCLKEAKIESYDIDEVYVGFIHPVFSFTEKASSEKSIRVNFIKGLSSLNRLTMWAIIKLNLRFGHVFKLHKYLFTQIGTRRQKKFLSQKLRIPLKKIFSMDHHTAHAFAAYYARPDVEEKNTKNLVITVDGEGDGLCSRVFTVVSDRWKEIGSTDVKHSIGLTYSYITKYLGMKPNEHEYKVMGLAPYSHKDMVDKVLDKLKKDIWVEKLSIKSRVPVFTYFNYLEKYFSKLRFDIIAGSIQKLTEEILVKLIDNAISKTKIQNVILGGGVFMNVKANMEIAKLPKLKKIFVMPSCGDESTAIGAAFYGYRKYCKKNGIIFNPKPIDNLYLGPSFSDSEISKNIEAFAKQNIKIRKMKNPAKEIASIIYKGGIVARLSGRMEFGARALGNRSILANPADPKVIRIINDQIKGRDFWMPFAAVILKERLRDYIVNPKKIDSPFMMIAFETTPKAQKDLIAALHPYDYTCRPQILSKDQNPSYHEIIKEFEALTGTGGLLNTSFNLHGEPIVCSPSDALITFKNSGLKYLVLENYLIEKKF
ncbi:MAG: hypothetical protein M1524_00750 [Patescibacteria group bacterium]|nr:hypothetical protein [Patescibacteria group bacterium]